MIKAVVFDFDGTLVDSNRLKNDAFVEIFSGDPHISEALVRDTLARNVGTRFDILRDIFVRLGAAPEEIEKSVARYADRFDERIQKGIQEKGLVAGAREVLERLSADRCLYINSATPQPALHAVVAQLSIARYFKAVHGVPPTKEENLREIIGREGVAPEEVAVVGDGESDRHAAHTCKTHFIGVVNDFNQWQGTAFPLVAGIREAEAIIQKI